MVGATHIAPTAVAEPPPPPRERASLASDPARGPHAVRGSAHSDDATETPLFNFQTAKTLDRHSGAMRSIEPGMTGKFHTQHHTSRDARRPGCVCIFRP